MTFTITYHGAGGKTDILELDAPNKESVWPILNQRGITAISVVEKTSSGWNRSKGQPLKSSKDGGSSKTKLTCTLVFCLVALIGGAVWYFISQKPSQEIQEPERSSKGIKAVKPSLPPKPKEPKMSSLTPEERKIRIKQKALERTQEPQEEQPQIRTNKYGRIVKMAKPIPPRKDNTASFKNVSEAYIGSIFTMDPNLGSSPFAMQFPENFTEDLKACLNTPIEILETDTENEIAIKRSVEEAKKELRERMRNGEDPGEIVKETKRELETIARYKEELREQLRMIVTDPGLSDDDIQDYVSAANKMLEEKGADPIKAHPMMIRALRLRASRKAANAPKE